MANDEGGTRTISTSVNMMPKLARECEEARTGEVVVGGGGVAKGSFHLSIRMDNHCVVLNRRCGKKLSDISLSHSARRINHCPRDRARSAAHEIGYPSCCMASES